MGEVMIPPWVRPESPETIRWIDDATQSFQPMFGRGATQRGIWADPRWGLRRRYRGLRSDEKAAILNSLNESRGQFNIMRVTPHAPLRGSMATGELLSNNTFASGMTGWSTGGEYAGSVSDRVMRLARTAVTTAQNALAASAEIAVTQYAPYVMRFMVKQGSGVFTSSGFRLDDISGTNAQTGASQTSYGLLSQMFVSRDTNMNPALTELATSGLIYGDYILVPYASFARCALVDNGPNYLQQTEGFNNVVWTKTASSISANSATSPTGNGVADKIVEDTSNATHYAQQTVSISSGAIDLCITCALKASGRNFGFLYMKEDTGNTNVNAVFDLSGGTVGTITTGANWASARAYIAPLGNSWYYCALVARKTNAATSLTILIGPASNSSTISYTGDGASGVYAYRAGVAQSGVPTMLTTDPGGTPFPTGNSQAGGALYTKGWPASESGLLLTGDWIEINGELKQLTAPVNSDAAGLAYIQFRPSLADSPDDNDPIVVHEPFGRFIYPQGTRELENLFGIYGDCEMNLEEVYV